jgi:endonuclease/exonuclease/phosphatase family metal-dependent hydrolase
VKRPGSLANWQALDAELGPECLRVASYNVHGCVGRGNVRDVGRIAAVIGELGCDTVGLQEVYGAEELSRLTGFSLIEGTPHKWHERHVGNALLTRRRVLAVRHHDWTWLGHEPRAALDVDLEAAGEPVRVIVTHLGLQPYERRAQVRKILELLRQTPVSERLIVLGDINEWLPLGRPLRWLHELLGHSPAERSFPARWPLFALDRVWVRPRHSLLAFGAHRSPLAALASDHLPVKAIISSSASSAASKSIPSRTAERPRLTSAA